MRHGRPLEHLREHLALLDRHRADEHRLAALVVVLDLLDHRLPLLLGGAVDEVGAVVADHRLVGGDDDDVELVDLAELGRLGVGGAGHAGELAVHAEVVLEGDGGERLVLALDGHPFLRLDRLVQAVGPAAAGHHAAGELVDDDHLAVLDQVVDVALEQVVRAQPLVDGGEQLHVLELVEVVDVEQLLDLGDALVGDRHRVRLLVDEEVACRVLAAVALLDLLALHQLGDDLVDAVVAVGGFLGRAADDQRRARLVDEDGVDLVDDRVVVPALHHRRQVELHVVAQVVEAELVVGAVGDVGGVGGLAVGVGHVVLDDADGQAEEAVDLAHPLGVAARQVVVDGHHVHALAGERVQVDRQGGHEGLALAGLHLGDLALVQHDAAHQLHVEGAQAEGAAGGLAGGGEGARQDLVEGGALRQLLLELEGDGAQPLVALLLHLRLDGVDGRDDGQHGFDVAVALGAEDLGEDLMDHRVVLAEWPGWVWRDAPRGESRASEGVPGARTLPEGKPALWSPVFRGLGEGRVVAPPARL